MRNQFRMILISKVNCVIWFHVKSDQLYFPRLCIFLRQIKFQKINSILSNLLQVRFKITSKSLWKASPALTIFGIWSNIWKRILLMASFQAFTKLSKILSNGSWPGQFWKKLYPPFKCTCQKGSKECFQLQTMSKTLTKKTLLRKR